MSEFKAPTVPSCSTRSAISHRKWPLRPLPRSSRMPRRRAAITSDTICPASSMMLFGGWRKHVRDNIARFEDRQKFGQWRQGLTHVDHDWQIERGGDFLRTPEDLKIVRAGHVSRQPRLNSGDHLAISPDRLPGGADMSAVDVHSVAFLQDTTAPGVYQNAAWLRRSLGDCYRLADSICAPRSCIDQPRPAFPEAQPRHQ